MKKAFRKSLAAFLSLLMLMSVFAGLDLSLDAHAAGLSGYSGSAAAQWAIDHWNDVDSVILGTGYWYDGGDCANFVSQCLYMGGLDMDSLWNTNGYFAHWGNYYESDYSGSFIRCQQLYNYLVSIGAQAIRNPSASQVGIGDVLLYSKTGSSRMTHSAIVIDIRNGTPVVAAHSVDEIRYRSDWSNREWHLGFESGRTYLMKLNGALCVNQKARSFDVYTARSGDLRLYNGTSTSSGYSRTFISGEYAHVYNKVTIDGYTWGYTYRYGAWGWIRLVNFHYHRHIDAVQVTHDFGDWYTVKPATCLENGTERHTCRRCGYNEDRPVAGGHITEPSATCLTPGLCKICGAQTQNSLGHDWDNGAVTTQPTCTEEGVRTYVCRRDASHTYTEPVSALGHAYVATPTAPTCVQDGISTMVCSRCGDTQVVYVDGDNTWSEWTTDSPETVGLSGDKVRQKTQYRYRDKETTTSYETSVDGWTRDGGSWVDKGTSYVDYIPTWPSGFDRNSSDYAKYNKTPKTNSETETTKIEVTGTSTVGYMYWHWCYLLADMSVGENNRKFGCYYNYYVDPNSPTTEFESYVSDNAVSFNSSANAYEIRGHSRFTWWWTTWGNDKDPTNQLPVLRCTYKTYNKLFNYYRWTDWSAWQDTMLAGIVGSREVESRTVYSYDLAALGHNFTVETEKNYPNEPHQLAASELTADCYTKGLTCSRCGAVSPDSQTFPHSIADFETEKSDYTLITAASDPVEVWRTYCRNGCGCWYDVSVSTCQWTAETVAPTCTAEGYTLHTCSIHGETYTSDNVPALGHAMNSPWTVTKQPTCTEEGEMERACDRFAVCGYKETQPIPALGHTMTKNDAVVPTCTEDGQEAYYHCSGCDRYFADEAGDTEIEENSWVIPALGHNEGIWRVIEEPGCGKAGYEGRYCTRENPDGICDCLLEEREIPALIPDYYVSDSHNAEEDDNGEWKAVRCDDIAYVTYTCRVCGDTYTVMLDPAPHRPGDWTVDEEAYCVHPGHRCKECTVCGMLLDEQVIEAPAAAHNYVVDETIESVCTAGTPLNHYVCTVCKAYGAAENDDVCARCGMPHAYWEGDPVDHNLAHDDRSYAPTCTEEGREINSCQNPGCTYEVITVLPPIGHDYREADRTPATCTAYGTIHMVCANDASHEYVITDFDAPPLGHDFGAWNDEEDGEHHTRDCSRGDKTETEAHAWDEGVITRQPTAETAGEKKYTCGDCGAVRTEPIPAKGWVVTFIDDDDSDLGTQTGATLDEAKDKQPEPEKEGDAQFSYAFDAWEQVSIDEDAGTAVFKAVYAVSVNRYTVTWKNADGAVLETDKNVLYGATPNYDGATPVKAATAQYTYTFAGWTPEVSAVTGDATYTATFTSTVNKYTVTWKNADGTVLEKDTDVPYGATPGYDGATPAKAATEQYTYTFAGWTPEVVSVTGDAVYTATCSSAVNQYTVTFVDEDGTTVLEPATLYDYGTPAADIVTPADPAKAPTAQYTYTFAGWTPDVAAVAGDATYTATFTSTVNKYTVTFKDENGDVLKTEEVVYGSGATAPADPVKEADAEYHYAFSGWDKDFSEVTGDLTVTATYTAAAHIPTENIITPATCTEDGEKEIICSACGRKLDVQTIPAHGHDYHKIDEKCVAPDYGVDGYDYYECSHDANHNYTDPIPALVRNVYTVTFIADGETVAVVPYTEGDKFVEEPQIPEKDNHTAEWPEYELNDTDITVEAVYTPIDLNNISDIKTEKTVDSFEDGVATITLSASAATRAVRFTSSAKKPVDVIMVLDLSGSMAEKLGEGTTQTKMEALKECAVSFIEKINRAGDDNRVALVGFASGDQRYNKSKWENTGLLVTQSSGFVSYPNAVTAYHQALLPTGDITGVDSRILNAINGLEANGATCTHIGLLMAKNILSSYQADGREKVVVLLTDGNPTIGGTVKDEINKAAPLAVTYANHIKSKGVKLYTIGVDANADENAEFTSASDGVTETNGTTAFDFNRFLNIVSTNYPDAKAMNNYGTKKNAGYYMSVNNTAKLDEIFSKILVSSVDKPVAFTKCNIVDTLSDDFVLTLEQEYAMRDKLLREYNIPDANISVERNADETTTIRVNGVPAVKTEVDGKTAYVASVTFDASLKAYEAGEYETNTDNAYAEIGGERIAGFDIPERVTVTADRNIVVFRINGEIYRIEEGRLGDAIIAPATQLAEWAIEEGTVITGNYAEFEATQLTSETYTVTWDIDGEETTVTYPFGAVINVPPVENKTDLDFAGFTPSVPHIMPAKNMVFKAVYAPKHVHQFRQTSYYGTCTEGLTIVSTCSCGETQEEQKPAETHRFSAVIGGYSGNQLTDTLVCSACGVSEAHTLTFHTVTTRYGRTTLLDLTLKKNGTVIQPAAGSTVKIMIPWTNQGYANTDVTISRINEQGVQKFYTATVENGYLVFYADHFSIYVIEELDGDGNVIEPVNYARAVCELNGTHAYTAAETAPTCTENGFVTWSCPNCGDSYTEPGAAATGHADLNGDGLCDECGGTVSGDDGEGHQSNCVCGKNHTGPLAWLIRFFHRIVYFFKNLFGKN